MRTSRRIIFAFALGAIPVATPGFAFDGAPANQDATIPVVAAQPGAVNPLKNSIPPATPESTITRDYAAEEGSPPASTGCRRHAHWRPG